MTDKITYPTKGNEPIENSLQQFALTRPILMCVGLFIIALFFRWIDSFVLRFDELLGELILTKSLGFALVLVWVFLVGRKVSDIGLHSSKIGFSLLIGTITTAVAFVFGYSVEFIIAAVQGNQPYLQFGAIDPKLGVAGGIFFALWLLLGNIVNSFMEEGLFRGVMGRLGRIRFSFWQTIWFTAFMFSIWHLPWVVKYYQLGQFETGSDIVTSVLFNSVPQLLIGLVYGYLYLKTGSLWTPWIAHTLSNSASNFLHVITTEGIDPGLPIRYMVYLVIMFVSLIWVKNTAEKQQMPEIKPWE